MIYNGKLTSRYLDTITAQMLQKETSFSEMEHKPDSEQEPQIKRNMGVGENEIVWF